MAVYNGERYLGEALRSVLGQSFPDFELIVIDDGSTDSTPSVLGQIAEEDPRIVVHRQINRGRAAALNLGLAMARAPLVARMDADDVALERRLELQYHFLRRNTDIAGVGGALTFIDEDGCPFAHATYPTSPQELYREFLSGRTALAHPAVTVRKSVLEAVGGYRDAFGDADDVDLWLRILDNFQMSNLPEEVLGYRIHRSQATVRGLEHQALCCVAAHVAARARRSGGRDPFDGIGQIDLDGVLRRGGTKGEIARYFVETAIWLAKTADRAGYRDLAESLFSRARDKAGSEDGSSDLVARVHRARAQRLSEEGRRLRAATQLAIAAFYRRSDALLGSRHR